MAVMSLVISNSAVDYLDDLVSEMSFHVSDEMLKTAKLILGCLACLSGICRVQMHYVTLHYFGV